MAQRSLAEKKEKPRDKIFAKFKTDGIVCKSRLADTETFAVLLVPITAVSQKLRKSSMQGRPNTALMVAPHAASRRW